VKEISARSLTYDTPTDYNRAIARFATYVAHNGIKPDAVGISIAGAVKGGRYCIGRFNCKNMVGAISHLQRILQLNLAYRLMPCFLTTIAAKARMQAQSPQVVSWTDKRIYDP